MLSKAVMEELTRRFSAMGNGIRSYRHFANRHGGTFQPDAVVWREGTSSLLGYGLSGDGVPVFIVPSLVNRGYILDLQEGASFARWLSDRGHPVYLMDWDAPGDRERGFDLTAYIARLESAYRSVSSDVLPAVLGYCMGGNLALGLVLRLNGLCRAVAMLATPWDFHAEGADRAKTLAASLPAFQPVMDVLGELPVDAINGLFAGLDPLLAYRKFQRFAGLPKDSAAARRFVELEDWLNDGIPLAAPVARECFAGWYGENSPSTGLWKIDGRAVDPAAFEGRSLVVIPDADRIVPPASTTALATRLRNCHTLRPNAGHIGMMASRSAQSDVWPKIADFLNGG
jgi:polyhydroxyalkanoate synthase